MQATEKEHSMAKNIQKLKPDTVVKNYRRDNGHFADFFDGEIQCKEQKSNAGY